MKPHTCIGLLAREHGLAVAHLLTESSQYKLAALFTHKLNPASQDPQRKERENYSEYQKLAKRHHIPLYTIDRKSEEVILDETAKAISPDFLISVSWRRILPKEILSYSLIGAINVHRGDLPKYAGAEPIKCALQSKEDAIEICAHIMAEKCDEGRILARATHPVNYDQSQTFEKNIERIKKEITPYFPNLVRKSIDCLLQEENITFREAEKTEKDARLVMDWRNDLQTRAMSFHNELKTWETFWGEYCAEYFCNPHLPTLFAYYDQDNIAVIKFNKYASEMGIQENAIDIGINMAPKSRKKGLGTIVLRKVTLYMLKQGYSAIVAEIKPENSQSIAAFIKAGYTLLDSVDKRVNGSKEIVHVNRYITTIKTHPEAYRIHGTIA